MEEQKNHPVENIFNIIGSNPEFNKLMTNLFKTINTNINHSINDDEFKEEEYTQEENPESPINNENSTLNFKKNIDIKKDIYSNDLNDTSLIDILMFLFTDKNGNNIADIMSELSNNIGELNKIKEKFD